MVHIIWLDKIKRIVIWFRDRKVVYLATKSSFWVKQFILLETIQNSHMMAIENLEFLAYFPGKPK